MRRFRTQWLALFGALVILSLSISSVFAARPVATDTSSSFGGQVSTFVHLLVSGTNDDTTADDGGEDENSDNSDECQPASDEDGTEDGTTEDGTTEDGTVDDGTTEDGTTEDGTSNQDAADESGDEDTSADDCTDQSDEDSGDDTTADDPGAEDSAAPTAQNHGQCVAEVARDMTQLGENGTHGWAVALAAQVTCWLDLNGDQSSGADENSGSDNGSATDEGSTDDTSTASTKPHGKSDAAHEHKLDGAAHGKPTWVSSSTHGGQGKGHGHAHGH
jgi:hypothetical protein